MGINQSSRSLAWLGATKAKALSNAKHRTVNKRVVMFGGRLVSGLFPPSSGLAGLRRTSPPSLKAMKEIVFHHQELRRTSPPSLRPSKTRSCFSKSYEGQVYGFGRKSAPNGCSLIKRHYGRNSRSRSIVV